MRAHFLQHVPFEGLGSIQDWLDKAGYSVTSTRFFESDDLPDPDAIDVLIVMGGPMSVNDETEFPWLVKEKTFVRAVMDRGTPVVGVCLGAQLIASSLGAVVKPGEEKEIGWFSINAEKHGSEFSSRDDVFSFPETEEVFHWHGETFDLPAGAVRLASSSACLNQAFQWGERVIGLQFHLETTPQSAAAIVNNCREELETGRAVSRYVQTETEILGASAGRYERINVLMEDVLGFICR